MIENTEYHVLILHYDTINPREESANPFEVRRILTMGLPFHTVHAGQILFGPADEYLYYVIRDGSNGDNTYGFAHNKKSLLWEDFEI